MTVLVTGGTGFVGSAIVRALIASGERTRCLVRRTSDRRNLAGLAVDLAQVDLAQEESLAGALKGCEALFHVAADYRALARRPQELIRPHVDGNRRPMPEPLRQGREGVVY